MTHIDSTARNRDAWPIKPHRNIGAYTLQELGRRIVSGAIAPGEKLPNETNLAIELGVSKTVIRETIRGLVAKGLVAPRPKLGTHVLPVEQWHTLDPDVLLWQVAGSDDSDNSAFLSDLDEFRAALEPVTAQLAALRATELNRLDLVEAFETMAANVDDDPVFFEADIGFHTLLITATQNLLLGGLREAVTTSLRVRHRTVAAHAHTNSESIDFHRAVLDAVLAADPGAADTSMRRLLAISAYGESARNH